MENNPLRGLFGVSSPRPEPQLATPQSTAPTENIEYEIPVGERSISKNVPTTTQDLSTRCIATRWESVSMYPR